MSWECPEKNCSSSFIFDAHMNEYGKPLHSGAAHVCCKNILGGVCVSPLFGHTYTQQSPLVHVNEFFILSNKKLFHPPFHEIHTTTIQSSGSPSCHKDLGSYSPKTQNP